MRFTKQQLTRQRHDAVARDREKHAKMVRIAFCAGATFGSIAGLVIGLIAGTMCNLIITYR